MFGARKMESSIEPCWRKAPRIISRSRLRPSSSNLSKKNESVASRNDNEMDDEVGEGFVVRGGVMMRIADSSKEQWKPVKRFYIDVNRSQIYQDARIRDNNSLPVQQLNPSRVIVEISALPGDGRMLHLGDNLPGVANEVESYPCRYCPDRVFLTSFGLERHTELEHEAYLPEVLEDISRIHKEWRRREELKAVVKKRREALKKTRMLTEVVRQFNNLPPEEANCNIGRQNSSFTNCHICGLSFESNSEALTNHIRAHRKNDSLRRRLLENFGSAYVARCTCYQCHLVFINEKNLMLHKETSHVKKRTYVCKWCGDVCLSVNELNEHKKDVHGVSYSRVSKTLSISSSHTLGKGTAKDNVNVDECLAINQSASANASESTKNLISVLSQSPFLTKCSECGLTTVKPSLLIRHMQRVHNKCSFSASIEVKGVPNIGVDVDRGKVTWWCCNLSFDNRHCFIHHRRSCHQLSFQNSNWPVETGREDVGMEETVNCDVIGEGQIVRLVDTDGTESDELYFLMAERNDPGNGALAEMPPSESVAEDTPQITLTAEEYMQLKRQFGGNFDDSMQLVLVDDVNDEVIQQPSPSRLMDSSVVDFIANGMVDSDILNSSLISGTQISSTDDKFYGDTHTIDSEFSVTAVSDTMDDDTSQGDLPLPSESLVNAETTSTNVQVPAVTFGHSSLEVSNILDRHFPVQGNSPIGRTTIPRIPAPISAQQQQQYGVMEYSVCPELVGMKAVAPSPTYPTYIMINNKVTNDVTSSSNVNYYLGDSKPGDFLEKLGNNSVSFLDNIPSLVDLKQKDTITTTTATGTLARALSPEQNSLTNTVGDNFAPVLYHSRY